jgi:ribosomal protein S18 acetylase RimI-like enzyme
LAVLNWNETQKEAFLRMQFTAQHRYYRAQFPAAAFQIILAGNLPIGRLYVDRREDEIRIIDIALLPQHRNAGIGSAILKDVLAEAAQAGVPARIHVERFNPALRLYERLGFFRIAETEISYLMEWSQDGSGASVRTTFQPVTGE